MAIIHIRLLSRFSKKIDKVISKELYAEVAEYLALNPKSGDVIPGLHGLRKVRFKSKGKGKSGGIRVIYYFYSESFPLFLFDIYEKSVQSDLSSQDKKDLVKVVKQIKNDFKMGQ